MSVNDLTGLLGYFLVAFLSVLLIYLQRRYL